MTKLAKCPEFLKFVAAGNESNSTTPELVLHAQSCEECFFWLPWMFAINQALAETWRKRLDDNCPPSSFFMFLLVGAVSCARLLKLKRPNRELRSLPAKEFKNAFNFNDHLKRRSPEFCKQCREYYDKLFELTLELQTEHLRTLKSGGVLIFAPVIAKQFNASEYDQPPFTKPD